MEVIIIGTVGTAKNIIEQIIDSNANDINKTIIKGIIIDNLKIGKTICNIPIIGNTNNIQEIILSSNFKFIFALYKPEVMSQRTELFNSYNIPIIRLANFIHPSVYLSASSKLGKGNVILSNSTIQSDVRIGNCNIINSNTTIEHNSIIGNNNFIAANVCIGANVNIQDENFIGLNSSIRENITINKTFVGMHSLVLSNLENKKVFGIPAKNKKK